MKILPSADVSRRSFVSGILASTALGCMGSTVGRHVPRLRLGVVSDMHVTTPESCAPFERALAYFRSRQVDAVVMPGDLTDWGLKSGLEYVKAAWDKVMKGTGIVPLSVTGNHDYHGWCYGDITMEMHANGYSEDERLEKLGVKETWEEVFGEPWVPIRLRQVGGHDFVCVDWMHEKEVVAWLREHGAALREKKVFFYMQHDPLRLTKEVKAALKDYPNCIAFTGHAHVSFNDERSIRQEEVTEISVPSLSCTTPPWDHENGEGSRKGECTYAMPMIPDRLVLRGGQGYVVSLFDDEMVVERRDIAQEAEGAAPWRVPLPVTDSNRPYDFRNREKTLGVPAFPAGATFETFTRNTENRQGKWTIVMVCTFPTATVADGTRVWDYEIRAVPKDGSAPMVKRFLSPAYSRMVGFEPKKQRFWFNVADLPQDREYVLEAYARNCFGKCSAPIVSKVWHGKPGLQKYRR